MSGRQSVAAFVGFEG